MENKKYHNFGISKHCICLKVIDRQICWVSKILSHFANTTPLPSPCSLDHQWGPQKQEIQVGENLQTNITHWALFYLPKYSSDYMVANQWKLVDLSNRMSTDTGSDLCRILLFTVSLQVSLLLIFCCTWKNVNAIKLHAAYHCWSVHTGFFY